MTLHVDVRLDRPGTAQEVAEAAADAERAGYSAIWTRESANDAFLPLAIAASSTQSIGLGTAIAVAFARNPMNVAYLANDLARYSDGRFTLGLGTQIKAHIERRFSMPWSRPAARMEEFVCAVREIWRCWRTGDTLRFEGEFFRHTLMLPTATPPPHAHPDPPIMLAAVGDRMLDVAGRVADGLLVHAFSTPEHLRQRTLPAVEAGLVAAGRDRSHFTVSMPVFVVTGADDQEFDVARSAMRRQIAFYGSTAAYRPVLETHGWGDLATELNRLSRTGDADRWTDMARLIDDDVLDAFAVVGEAEEVPRLVVDRVVDVADRIALYTAAPASHEALEEIAHAVTIEAASPTRATTSQEDV